jgi:hypothetical protein
MVRAKMVLMRERYREENQEARGGEEEEVVVELDEEEADYELRDFRKRVKVDDLVLMYAALLDIDVWYNMLVDEGIALPPGVGLAWR